MDLNQPFLPRYPVEFDPPHGALNPRKPGEFFNLRKVHPDHRRCGPVKSVCPVQGVDMASIVSSTHSNSVDSSHVFS